MKNKENTLGANKQMAFLNTTKLAVARNARADIEQRLGRSVISNEKAIDHITPKDELPFKKNE
jgi:hypothetical protein